MYYTHGLVEGGVQKQFLTANLVDPSIADGAASIPVDEVPIREFSNNVGYASDNGLRIRYLLRGATHGQNSLVEDSTFWNNKTGMLLIYGEHLILRNNTITTAASQPQLIGIQAGSTESADIVFDHLNISGYTTGINMPRRGYSAVIGGTFNNAYDLVFFTAGEYDRYALVTDQSPQLRIKTEYDVTPLVVYPATTFLVKDVITLNYGPFVNQRLYGLMQLPTSVPFPVPRADLPAAYVGLTNQQLWNQFGVALGGEIAPSNYTMAPSIIGLIGPPA